MQLKESGQMYLETIYVLSKEKAYVRSIDVGEHLGYSRPSVSRAMSILRNNGYILMDKSGYITLTEKGEREAKKVYERHVVISKFFVLIGVDKENASKDACRIEHVIGDVSFDAVKKFVEERSEN